MITIPIDDKDKKKKEQQQNTQPAQPAPTEQTTTTATTTEQTQQPQGPIPWEITTEEKKVNPDVYKLYQQNYEPREKEIQGIETDYLDKMSKMYGLINQNSEKTKEALKKQPIADAFNMLGTAVGKLSEVASNATFSGRVAPKKVDSSDIAKQGNALLKKSYELPQYLQAIDNDIIQNKAKQLQNEYAVNMNRLQRQMQYIQNAIEQSTDKTKIKYLSQEAIELKEKALEMKRKHDEKMEQIAQQKANAYTTSVYNEGNNLSDGFNFLEVDGKRYKVSDEYILDILDTDLFDDKEKKKLLKTSTDNIRGVIQYRLNKGERPQKYDDGTPFSFENTLGTTGKEVKRTY